MIKNIICFANLTSKKSLHKSLPVLETILTLNQYATQKPSTFQFVPSNSIINCSRLLQGLIPGIIRSNGIEIVCLVTSNETKFHARLPKTRCYKGNLFSPIGRGIGHRLAIHQDRLGSLSRKPWPSRGGLPRISSHNVSLEALVGFRIMRF